MVTSILLGNARLQGFPNDADVLGIQYELATHSLNFLLEHPSFQLVAEGAQAPVLSVKVEQVGIDYAVI